MSDTDPTPTVEALDVGRLIALARRRWPLIVAVALTLVVLTTWWTLRRPDLYTSQALVQKLEVASPLSSLATAAGGGGLPPGAMASEVELIESDAVLGRAVARLALDLRLPQHPARRSAILAGASSSGESVPGEYVLRRDGEVVTLAGRGGSEIASGAPGDTLDGPGFRIPVSPAIHAGEEVPLQVVAIPDAISDLRDELAIVQAENTRLIRIRIRTPDPDLSAAIVNAVADAYQLRAADVARDEATRRRAFLAEQLASVADSVREAQAALTEFQQTAQVLDPATEGEGLAQGLRAQEAEVRQLDYQQNLLRSLVGNLENSSSGEGMERIVTLSEDVIPGAAPVYARVRQLEDERRRLTTDRYGYREGSSRVAVLDSLIGSAREELRSLAQEALNLTGSRLQEARSEASQLRSQVGQLPAQATAIQQLEQNAATVLGTFNLLSARFYEAQVAEAVAAADVEVVDHATPSLRPDERAVGIPIALAGIIGLGLGLAGALLVESLDRTVGRSGDVEAATGLPLLGMIPLLDKDQIPEGRAAPLVVGQEHVGGPVAEAFTALPAMIRYARAEEVRTIAVVSQGPREGKSFTAANLALAFAQREGRKTLLIDCDLHRPQIGNMFGLPLEPGLADVLSGQATRREVARRIGESSLTVIPAGGRSPDPGHLLGSQPFADFLECARENYDVIVVDTPPILAVSESLTIGRLVDGMVVVARAQQTNRFALAEAVSRLRRVEAPLLGVVVNGVSSGDGSGGYGSYYYRYYTYDYQHEGAGAAAGRG